MTADSYCGQLHDLKRQNLGTEPETPAKSETEAEVACVSLKSGYADVCQKVDVVQT